MGYNLLINGVYWGYNPPTNHLLTSWDIQVVVDEKGYTIGSSHLGKLINYHGDRCCPLSIGLWDRFQNGHSFMACKWRATSYLQFMAWSSFRTRGDLEFWNFLQRLLEESCWYPVLSFQGVYSNFWLRPHPQAMKLPAPPVMMNYTFFLMKNICNFNWTFCLPLASWLVNLTPFQNPKKPSLSTTSNNNNNNNNNNKMFYKVSPYQLQMGL